MKGHAIRGRIARAAMAIMVGRASLVYGGSQSAAVEQIVARVHEVAGHLERYDFLGTSWVVQCDAVLRAWLAEVDPQARYGLSEEIRNWLAAEEGRVYQAEVEIAITNGTVMVAKVPPAFEAEKIGLVPGMIVTAIDQAPLAGVDSERIRTWLQSFRDNPIIFSVLDMEGNAHEISVPVREWRRSAISVAEVLPTKIAYVKLNGLYSESDREVTATLARWIGEETCYGIILDLRGAGGRDGEAAARVAGMFAADGQVLGSMRDKKGNILAHYTSRASFKPSVPVMVLLDETTRGAAELCAVLIKGLGAGAMLIGAPSQGDPLVREPIELSWGAAMYIATRSVVAADGTVYGGRERVIPHIETASYGEQPYEPDISSEVLAKMTDQEKEDRKLRLRVRNDAVLRRAVELLQGLKALNVRLSAP